MARNKFELPNLPTNELSIEESFSASFRRTFTSLKMCQDHDSPKVANTFNLGCIIHRDPYISLHENCRYQNAFSHDCFHWKLLKFPSVWALGEGLKCYWHRIYHIAYRSPAYLVGFTLCWLSYTWNSCVLINTKYQNHSTQNYDVWIVLGWRVVIEPRYPC